MRFRKRKAFRSFRGKLDAEAFLRDVIGARNMMIHGDEIIHSCPLPFGQHTTGDSNPSAALNKESLLWNCFRCLAGETKVITAEGTVPIRDLAGGFYELLTTEGKWVKAEILSFGVQRLMKVTLTRNRRVKTIFATPEHEWFLQVKGKRTRAKATTAQLLPGHRLRPVVPERRENLRLDSEGVRHGFVFGDGTRSSRWTRVMLCGKKDAALASWFTGYPTSQGSHGPWINHLPGHFKEMPSLEDNPSYLYGWLAGYFAADGCVSQDGQIILASARRSNLEFVRMVADRLGIMTFGIGSQTRMGFGPRPSDLFFLRFVGSTLRFEFFLIDIHRKRFQAKASRFERIGWTVRSVEETSRVEEVFCAIVPGTHAFALEDHILTSNCGGGDIIWLTQTVLNLESNAAIAVLRGQLVPEDPGVQDFLKELEELFAANEELSWSMPEYSEVLLGPWKCHATYLDERGVSRDVQRRMRTGVDVNHQDKIGETWIGQPRLVIPHFFLGKLRGWQKRKLADWQLGPKYRSSPGFPKLWSLYHWDEVKKDEPVFVVESPMSVLMLLTHGFENCAATFGTPVSDEQIELLRGCDDVWLWFDGDSAGDKAFTEASQRLSDYTRVMTLPIPRDKDPANLSLEEIKQAVAERVPSFLREEVEYAKVRGQRTDRRHTSRARGRRRT